MSADPDVPASYRTRDAIDFHLQGVPQEMADAARVGFDRKELVTLPSLPDPADRERFDAARKAVGPGLPRSAAAARYKA